MPKPRFLMATCSLAVIGTIIGASGCNTFGDDCVTHNACQAFSPTSSGSGIVVPACPGAPLDDPTLIRDECGLFVRGEMADTDMGPGSKDKPYKTIQAAIDATTNKWIFVCSTNQFSEMLTISKGNLEIYGGFDCATWTHSPDGRTKIQGPADQIALTITANGAKLRNLAIKAGKPTMSGGSSIAVLASMADPSFSNCDLEADDGAPGVPGVSPFSDPALDGEPGVRGIDACGGGAEHPGPIGKTKTCSNNGGMSVGGTGGSGGPHTGGAAGDGTNGSPADITQPTRGLGGDRGRCRGLHSGPPRGRRRSRRVGCRARRG